MQKEVTVRGLNRAFMHSLFSSGRFWFGFVLYFVGVVSWASSMFISGIIMLVAALIMLSADYNGRKKVVKNLRWVK